MPSFSQERMTDAEIPVNSATSPIFRCPPEVAEAWFPVPLVCRLGFNDSLDKTRVDSLTLRNYSKVAVSDKKFCFCRLRAGVHHSKAFSEGGL